MGSSSKPTIQVGPIKVDFLVDAEDSGGNVTVFECFVPADSRMPVPHSHDTFEETVYGLEGTCTWTIDGHPRRRARRVSVHPPRTGPRV